MPKLFGLVIIGVALVIADSGSDDIDLFAPAHAQQQQGQEARRPNLFEMLFGGALRRQMQNRRQQQQPAARRVIVKEPRRERARQVPQKPIVEKAENAARILIVGDFLADGLAWGLEQAYAENPNVVFVDKSSGLSGLVRDDVVDWAQVTGEYVDEVEPIALVVVVGMNDRQQMRTAQGNFEKLSQEWRKEYELRIRRIIDAAKSRNVPLIWIGLPAVRSGNMNADYLVFNELYRTNVDAAQGQFVDIWDGFTNAEGAFISAGPDINGQIVRLRNSDGINMTRAGKRKLAFYAERAIRRATGLGSDAIADALPGVGGAEATRSPQYDPAATGKTIVISLDDPQIDGGELLEGAEEDTGIDESSTAYKLVYEGIISAPHDGRIDAQWGRPEPENTEEPIRPIQAAQ